MLQWSGSAQHSAEHLSRWEAMSKAMSLAPMDLELSSDAIGMSKGAIKRLRRHLKETGSDLPVEVLSYAVSCTTCSTRYRYSTNQPSCCYMYVC